MGTGIKIKYLYHSGFLIETDKHLLVFDYYQGQAEEFVKESSKSVVIFSSHSHPDHYNPVILEWQKERADIQYVFSQEISVPPKTKNLHFLSPYETLEIADLKVKAYNSTDIGVSFLVQAEGIRLFHAGDLNWWDWCSDTPEDRVKAEKGFKDEVQKIKGEIIDIAFFPVDPRLEQNYSAGAEYFIQELAPRVFIPMHFADRPEAAAGLESKLKTGPSQILKLLQRGQEVILNRFSQAAARS